MTDMSVQSLPSSLKETRTQGTVTFPCTVYRADASASEIPRPFITKVHWHDAVEILHFIHGHFRVRVGMEEYDICQEAFCFVGSGKLHAIYSADGSLEEALLFSPYILESPGVDSAERDLIAPLRRGQLALPLMIDESSPAFCQIRHEYQVCQAIFESRSRIQGDQHMLEDAASQLRVKAALMNILATLSETRLLGEPSGKEDPRLETLKKVLGYIRDHFSEKIYLSDLAQLMNMNEQYFCRFFRMAMGKTPLTYINETRIRQASVLLQSSELPVAQIAEDCGFCSPGHFITAFRKFTGTTPKRYRNQQRVHPASF